LVDASGSNGSEITGTEISDNNLTGSTGVDVSGSTDAVVEDTTVSGNDVTDSTLVDASGSKGTEIKDTEISDNDMSGSTGVDVSGSTDAVVEDTVISGNDVTDSTLVDASGSNGSEVTGTEISDNNLTDSTGVDVSGSSDAVVANTTISDNDVTGGTLVDASDSTGADIKDTEVTGNSLDDVTGIDVSGSTGAVVDDSVFEDNVPVTGSTLVDASGSNDAVIKDTAIKGNDITNSTLVDASGSTNVDIGPTEISNNTLINDTCIDVSDSINPNVHDTVIKDNVPVTGSTLIDASGSSDPVINGTTVSGNDMSNSTGVDVSNSTDAVVEDTTVSDNNVTGGTLVDASNSTDVDIGPTEISGNDMSGSTGIDVSNSSDAVVEDTVFADNDIEDCILIDAEDSTDGTINNITLDHNDMTDVMGINSIDAVNLNVSNVHMSGNVYGVDVLVSVDDVSVGEDAVVNVDVISSFIPMSGEALVIDGNVTVTVDGKDYTASLVDGKASVPIKGLKAGEYNVTADYLGSETSKPATGNGSFVVSKVADYPMGVENTTVIQGSDLIVDLPDDATGNVSVSIGDKVITAPVKDGKAVISTVGVDAGDYPVSVSYSGDDKYTAKNITDNVSVVGGIVVSAPDVTKYYHGPERFVVSVSDYAGRPVAGMGVSITINGVTYSRVTNANGTASLAINLEAGVYNTTVVVDGVETRFAVVNVLSTILTDDLVKMFHNGTQFWATFLDSNGNLLTNGTAVSYNIHGVNYTHHVRDGRDKLNINLDPGEYIITATNLVTGEMRSNTIKVLPLIESSDLVKYYRNATQFVVRLYSPDGSVAEAGAAVTFNINGVFYTRYADADGYAKLNINLEPGTYAIITTEYLDCKVGNSVKVLPTLLASDLTKKYGSGDQFVATVLDGQGRPYAGQTVTFNIHGIFYSRVTDSEGHAKLNINLQAGKYIVTSTYNGYNVSNTITVTA
jgi:hypothetical protein